MLENFHLAVVAKRRTQSQLLHVPLEQDMQKELTESWNTQKNEYLDDIAEVDFNPGYTPEDNERFRITDYDLPEWPGRPRQHNDSVP